MASPQVNRRRRIERIYTSWRAGQLEARPRCEAGPLLEDAVAGGEEDAPAVVCRGRSEVLHHRRFLTHLGAKVSQVNTVATCVPCHDLIHGYPKLAHLLGLIVREGDADWDECGVSEA